MNNILSSWQQQLQCIMKWTMLFSRCSKAHLCCRQAVVQGRYGGRAGGWPVIATTHVPSFLDQNALHQVNRYFCTENSFCDSLRFLISFHKRC